MRTRNPHAVLAAIAAVILSTGCGAVTDDGEGSADGAAAQILRAAGISRPIEGRLAMAPHWEPCSLPAGTAPATLEEPPCSQREVSDVAALAAAAEVARDHVARLPEEERRRAQALMSLVWNRPPGALADAVSALENRAERSGEPDAHGDLAAAYLLRAQRSRNPMDLLLALEAAESALRLDPDHPQGLFNRALSLEKLALYHEAIAAWTRAAAAGQGTQWADEALARRERVRAAGGESIEGVWTLRRRLMERALPGWARAQVDGDEAAADLLEEVLTASAAYGEASGDALFRNAAQQLAEGSDEGAGSVAAGVLALSAATRGLHDLDTSEEVLGQLRRAVADLDAAGSPMVHWATLQSVIADVYLQDWPNVQRKAHALVEDVDRDGGYPVVRGRALWMEGLALIFRGRRSEAIERYEEAKTAFEGASERVFAAAIDFLIGEAHQESGNYLEGWRSRHRALAELPLLRQAQPYRAHNLLYDAAHAATSAGHLGAAQAYASALVKAASGSSDPAMRAEAFVVRAQARLALDRVEPGIADLEGALRQSALVPGDSVRERLEQDARRVLSGAIADAEPERALELLAEAERFDRAIGHRRNVAELGLARARAHLALDQADEAVRSLVGVLADLGDDRALLASPTERVTLFRRARPILDRVVKLLIGQGDPRDEILGLIDSVRAAELAVPSFERFETGDRLAARVPRDLRVISFHATPDLLFLWELTSDGSRRIVRETPRGRLEALRTELRARVLRGEAHLAKTLLARGFDELIRPALGAGDARDLLIVPDPMFADLPFHALRRSESDSFLIEEGAVSTSPSLRVYLDNGGGRPCCRADAVLLVTSPEVADPRLRAGLPLLQESRDRALSISELYTTSLLLAHERATTAEIATASIRPDVLHFDGHTVSHGNRHALVLAGPRGLIWPEHVDEGLVRGARTVVLGGCSTGGGRRDPVEGPLGLAHAFLRAGADAVVSTLSPVEDQSASDLVLRLHAALAAGESPAAALRSAVSAVDYRVVPGSADWLTWTVMEARRGSR